MCFVFEPEQPIDWGHPDAGRARIVIWAERCVWAVLLAPVRFGRWLFPKKLVRDPEEPCGPWDYD